LGIDLIVSPQELDEDCSVFAFSAFGYAGRNCDGVEAELSVANAWKNIQTVCERVVSDRYSAKITWKKELQNNFAHGHGKNFGDARANQNKATFEQQEQVREPDCRAAVSVSY
jgi:hypothetical protein